MSSLADYPPARHVLRDLALEVEFGDGDAARGWMPATAALAAPDGGVRIGALATLVDVIGGGLAMSAVAPGRVATADLSLRRLRPPTGPVIEARLAILRRGRSTLVVDVWLAEVAEPGAPAGEPIGCGTLTFAVLAGSDDGFAPGPGRRRTRSAFAGGALDRPVLDAVGVTAGAPGGALTLPVEDAVRNSLGAVQGGILALFGEAAAAAAAAADGVRAATVVDLHVTYLALGRVGPLVARATPLAAGTGRAVSRVDIVDGGAADRLTTVVHASAASGAAR